MVDNPNPQSAVLDDAMVRVDGAPPPNRTVDTQFTGDVNWDERMDRLAAEAGAWYAMRTYENFQAVGSILQHLKRKAKRRGGRWEFTTRKTDEGVVLYGVCWEVPRR
jgi:hypothetical protein